eukprot:6464976-Amphidinium_carterae.1
MLEQFAVAAKKRKTDKPEAAAVQPKGANTDKDLPKVVQQLRKLVIQHDSQLRSLEQWSCYTWQLPTNSPVAVAALDATDAWKAQLVKGQAHPLGAPRHMVGASIVHWILANGAELQIPPDRFEQFRKFHSGLADVQSMEASLQLAFCRKTKNEGVAILRLRPAMSALSLWQPVLELLTKYFTAHGGKALTDTQPPGPAIRALQGRASSSAGNDMHDS